MKLTLQTPAKINVGLRILGRRPDGFHDLETLFLAVGLFDTLSFERLKSGGLTLEVEGADVGPAKNNLVTRAGRLFQESTGIRCSGLMRLKKKIPAGGGLGGGSSDAGAALRLLNRAFGYPMKSEHLADLGSSLGADVAFFATGSAFSLGTGRGEILTPVDPPPAIPVILGLPPVHVATGPAYGALATHRSTTGEVPPSLFGTPPSVSDGAAPSGWNDLVPLLQNDFECVVPDAFPEVNAALGALRTVGAPNTLLSGSGGAVFSLVPPQGDEDADTALARARRLATEARALLPQTEFRVVPTLTKIPAIEEAP